MAHPLARRHLVLLLALLALEVALATAFMAMDSRRHQLDRAQVRSTHTAQTVALAQLTRHDLARGRASEELSNWTAQVTASSEIDFLVVMDTDAIRLTHPDDAQVGRHYQGDLGTAPQGTVFTQEYTGSLGPSVRSVAPVLSDGRVVGYVSAGVTLARIQSALPGQLAIICGFSALLLATGGGGAVLISRRLRHETHGLGARELASMYEYHDSMLHAVSEGLLLVDTHGIVRLCNTEGRRLLGLDDDPTHQSVTELALPPALLDPLLDGSLARDQVVQAGDRILVVNQRPASFEGRSTGWVITFRDHTELQAITGELATVRGLTETLRSQNHESANRLHTVVSLVEMGEHEQAIRFATEQGADRQALMGRISGGLREPIFEALLLGKMAQARERGIELVLDEESHLEGMPITPGEAVTVVGNLLDNAFDAVTGRMERQVEVFISTTRTSFHFEVEDSGPGVAPELRKTVFTRGWSSKADAGGHGLGLALVAQVVARHGGGIRCGTSELGGALFEVRIDQEAP